MVKFKNIKQLITSQNLAAGGASEDGFAAIKLTALGRPQFLLQFSEALVSSRMLFETLAGVGKTENLDKSILEHGFDEHRFMDKAGRMGLSISRKGMQVYFSHNLNQFFTFS